MPFRSAYTDLMRCLLPPIHYKIGGLWHFGIGFTQYLCIAVAESITHEFVSDERWVADNVISGGPNCRARVFVSEQRDALAFVRHFAARHHVRFHAAPIPNGDWLSRLVKRGLRFAVVVEHGVAALDVFEFLQDGFAGRRLAARAEMPLQIANPQNHFGDGGGAGIDFEAQKLVRVNRVRGHFQPEAFAELIGKIEDFTFKAFQVFERDVKEIAAAARGIEDFQCAQAFVEAVDFLAGGFNVATFARAPRRRRGRFPIRPGAVQ